MNSEKLTSHSMSTKISGCVRSTDGAMLQGAKVECHGMETRTLADGSFVFREISPGRQKVKVSLQGFKPTSKTVSIREGEEAVLDFQLSNAIGTAKIHGQVYDAESKKNIGQGGTVILILPTANKYRNIDKDGYYEFENLPEGTYKIVTSILGYEDCEAIVTVADGETKMHNFVCKTRKTDEPPWG